MSPEAGVRAVRWTGEDGQGLEHCVLTLKRGGLVLEGMVAGNREGDSYGAHYIVRADAQGQTAFIVDLSYAGLFGLRNVPAEHVQPFLLGEAPRLLFPFARRVVADTIRDGGFPPLLLEPIDFGALYMQQAEAQMGQQAGSGFGQA